jgi:hypothetical protein
MQKLTRDKPYLQQGARHMAGNNSSPIDQPAIVIALLTCVLASAPGTAQSPQSIQTHMSGAEAVRSIDWQAVDANSPIPFLMPTAQSEDPVEAGFAPQWVQRAMWPPESPERKLALVIVSKRRTPDDLWAQAMEKELRAIVHEEVASEPPISRVFCNSAGCLCYVERDGSPLVAGSVFRELLGARGQKFGLQRSDLDAFRVDASDTRSWVWELTLVKRLTAVASPKPTTTN